MLHRPFSSAGAPGIGSNLGALGNLVEREVEQVMRNCRRPIRSPWWLWVLRVAPVLFGLAVLCRVSHAEEAAPQPPQPVRLKPLNEDGLRPIPDWMRLIYRDEYLGYKFELPATVRKEHPRLPHPSKEVLEYYRRNWDTVRRQQPYIERDLPALAYLITGDKKYFDQAVDYLKTCPVPKYGDTTPAFTLDWLYNELPEDVRKIAVEKCAQACEAGQKATRTRMCPTVTLQINREFYDPPGAIVVWGHHPKGDQLLRDAHEITFKGCIPTWHAALGPDGGCTNIPFDPFYDVILQHRIPYLMELWSNFLGEDLFKKYPWLRGFGYYPLYTTRPDMCGVPLGDCPRSGAFAVTAAQCALLAERYNDPYLRWTAYNFGRARPEAPRPMFSRSKHGYWAGYDATGKEIVPPEKGLPLERFFEGVGLVCMRSDWTENGTYAAFKIGDVVSNHNHCDSGQFFIYRNGTLASDRGTLTGDYVSGGNHYRNYTPLAVAHNVVTVCDPADVFVPNDGGQRAVAAQLGFYSQPSEMFLFAINRPEEVPPNRVRPSPPYTDQAWKDGLRRGVCGRPAWEMGDMLAYDPHDEYVYAAGDVTAAYQNQCSGDGSLGGAHRTKRLKNITRAFLYIRPDYFAVFDRADALKPEFEKKWLLQTATEPKVEGDTVTVLRDDLVKSAYSMQIQLMKGARMYSPESLRYQLHGKMFVKTLLPKERTIAAVGGPGREFWVDGKNYDVLSFKTGQKADPAPCPNDVGSWRIEVSPKEGRTLDYFLHVMQVGDSKTLDKMVPVEYLEKDGQVGFKMQANGGVYTVLFDQNDGIGGHITFERDGKRVIDRDFAEELKPNRMPARVTFVGQGRQ